MNLYGGRLIFEGFIAGEIYVSNLVGLYPGGPIIGRAYKRDFTVSPGNTIFSNYIKVHELILTQCSSFTHPENLHYG